MTILQENQYFDNEADFCRVYSEQSLRMIQKILLKNHISYFVKNVNDSMVARLLGRKACAIIRINDADITRAAGLIDDVNARDARLIRTRSADDWVMERSRTKRYSQPRLH